MNIVSSWFKRHLSDPQVVVLAIVLITLFVAIYVAGNMLTPVIASVVVAYLLEGIVVKLVQHRIPRFVAVLLVFSAFMAFLLLFIFAVLPMLSRQITELVTQLPNMIARGEEALQTLPKDYPDTYSATVINDVIAVIRSEALAFGRRILQILLPSVVGIITIAVYVVLMPLLVFFFMKDKQRILRWMTDFLPSERRLAGDVWRDVDLQIGNYVRGKFFEIVIVWAFTYITFALMELDFAMLLAVIVGLSVLIPYIGAVAVTVPVALIAYFQWGLSSEFAYVLVAYFVIQALDGNVLVPLLFSEVVNLHPVAIIVAILVFGGIWGFWGVFFAIPLATLVQSVISAWPTGPTTSTNADAAQAENG